MITLLLMAGNKREEQILKIAFEQMGITVLMGTTGYNNYVKLLQYVPDMIMIEMPKTHIDQIHFVNLIRTHKRTSAIPAIAYGDPFEEGVRLGILQNGASLYVPRPLKFSDLVANIKRLLKQAGKEIAAATPPNDRDRDEQTLLDKATPAMKKLEVLSVYVTKMLAFPFTVAKVLQITQDEKTGANDLAKAMESDPVISAHILRVSNSVFFATAERRISTVRDAIVRVGFREIKRISMTMSVMKLFAKDNKNSGFDRIDFWYHSLSCAVISSHVARHMGGINTEEAFLAGLLHDFGVLLLDEFFPLIFGKCLEATVDSGGHFVDKETELLGINHNDLIGELFPKWKIPQAITQGIIDQHKFQLIDPASAPLGSKLALCAGIGNILAKTLYLGRECDQFIWPIDNEAFKTARMMSGFTTQTIDAIYHDIVTFRQFLELEKRDFPFDGSIAKREQEVQIGVINAVNDIFVPPVHYLHNIGFSVERISSEKPVTDYDQRFDMLILWARNGATQETVEKFSHVVRNLTKPPDAGQPVRLAPILVMSDGDATPSPQGAGATVSYMRNRFDLRELDRRVMECLDDQLLIAQAPPGATTTPIAG